MIDSKYLNSLEWRLAGPHRGGRVGAVAGHPTDLMTFYFGACAGGVWKTTDGGWTWKNVSDGFFKVSAVGALAIAPSDPNVIYVGTGETNIRGNVSHGDGVYKSTDSGKTWTNMGLADTRHISKVRIHPTNPDLVYVAALGHAWGQNKERGVYRSSDGGKTWKQVLFRSEKAGAIDLTMDANNPRILYATIWEAQRYPYKLNSGGPDSSIYRTTDGGDTWQEITRNPGLPKGVLGKMGIDASAAKAGRVYAIVEAEDGACFRSDDHGDTWQRMSEQGELRGRPWYYMHIFADPVDADTVYILDYGMWKSIDGGKSFTEMQTPHGDNHGLWIDPKNSKRIIEGNDGGACVSFNGGESWSTLFNQPTAQFYHVTTDNNTPYRIYGSQQDNTAIRIASLSTRGAITELEWLEPGGGESGYIAIKPDNPNIVVAGGIGSGAGSGRLIHYNRLTDQERPINAWPEITGMAYGAIEHKYRFQWTFPLFFSRWDPNALYIAGNQILVSRNEGASWDEVSGDLTRNDPDKMQKSGGPITLDNTGAEMYCTIFALEESHHEKGVMWAGTDDGLVHITRDGGKTWENITPKGLPEWALISIIDVSAHDKATAYVAATRYKLDDTKPYLFKTNDYGKTWTQITNGIPDGEFTRVIRADPVQPGLLFAGTETGVYVSFDDGANWQRMQGSLPIVPIHDLHIKDSDLLASTHGRSFWVMDDLSPLREMSKAAQAAAYLCKPRDAIRWKIHPGFGGSASTPVMYRMTGPLVIAYQQKETATGEKTEEFFNAGKNPPIGVIVHYMLKDAPAGDVSLSFLDAQGNLLREFSSKDQGDVKDEDKEPKLTKNAGANRFVWNFRTAKATKLLEKKGGRGEYSIEGPVVAPGAYQVRLKVGDQTLTQTFNVIKDPRVTTSQADLQKQYDYLTNVRNKISEVHGAINRLRGLRMQAEGWAGRTDGKLSETAKALAEKLTSIESELIQVKSDDPRSFPSKLNAKIGALAGFVEAADYAPTQQLQEVLVDLSKRADVQLAALKDLEAGDISTFNEMVNQAGMGAIGAKA